MTYLNAHIETEAELHTISALLFVLDEVVSDHLGQDHRAMASGIVNLTRVVAERLKKAQDLHAAEHVARKGEQREDSPIATMHREIVRRHELLGGNHGLPDDEFEAFNLDTSAMADAIVDLPAQNADDMLRKIMGYSINGDHTDLSDTDRAAKIWTEMRALVAA